MEQQRQQAVPEVLKRLAVLLGTELKNRRLEIPEKFGKGNCSGFVFNEHIRMLIFNYELYHDLEVEDPDIDATSRIILFKFQHVFPATAAHPAGTQLKATPSVLIVTRGLNTGAAIPVHTHTATINIEVDAGYLSRLFEPGEKSPVLQSLFQNSQPLLFEQIVNPALQKIVDEMLSEKVGETFELFFLRLKAEELVCRLLMELEKRDEKQLYDLNSEDIRTIYNIRKQILEHLETPPAIKDLAVSASMSPTKLKRLFRQIFGSSIFNYYQQFRMKEAAFLLKEKKLSVSDAGYKMGFTNLSHFSRTFETHIGMKPKQYSRTAIAR